jgi:hypothetical protein
VETSRTESWKSDEFTKLSIFLFLSGVYMDDMFHDYREMCGAPPEVKQVAVASRETEQSSCPGMLPERSPIRGAQFQYRLHHK